MLFGFVERETQLTVAWCGGVNDTAAASFIAAAVVVVVLFRG